jgi:hypothetical protein
MIRPHGGISPSNRIASSPRDGIRGASVTYLLRDEFITAASAPLTSPRTAEPGPGTLTLVQTDGQMSISSDLLQIPVQTTPATGDLGYYSAAQSRALGNAAIFKLTLPSTGQFVIGWASSAAVGWINSNSAMAVWLSAAAMTVGETNVLVAVPPTLAASTEYTFAFVVRATGGYLLVKGGALTNWTLIWTFNNNATATMYAMLSAFSHTAFSQEYLRITTLAGIFASEYGPASVNVASPSSLAEYTATADQIVELTITAPGVLANEAGIRYRITDANNYWRAYFNSSGAFRVDSVSAGVATNRINVAGVIAGAGTVTIRVVCEGSLHDAYTQASATWTKRGAQLNVSHQNSSLPIAADIGAGWSVANLRSYPRSGIYSALDGV